MKRKVKEKNMNRLLIEQLFVIVTVLSGVSYEEEDTCVACAEGGGYM